MNDIERVFLNSIYDNLHSIKAEDAIRISAEDLLSVFALAEKQNTMPILYETFCKNGYIRQVPAGKRKKLKERALQSAIRQITQTNEFLTLILHMQGKGLDPIVIKGITCRNLYPIPCLRPSVDEDLLIMNEDTEKYHEFLLSEGLFADEADLSADDRRHSYELSYHRENSPTYIELHSSLFDPASPVFAKLNGLFYGAGERTVRVQIEDVSVRTLAPTDHMLYLILHAYKHFLHSGVGIRPMCDIGLYAKVYADEIDWQEVREKLSSVNAFYFAKALLRVVQLYLIPDASFYTSIREWEIQEVEVEPLLRDSLNGGVHGASSLTRLHSSNITLQAVESRDRRYGKGLVGQVMHSVFLPYAHMRERYPYLKRAVFLLPVAWIQRAVRYFLETHDKKAKNKTDNEIAKSVRLGAERVRLLRRYKVI